MRGVTAMPWPRLLLFGGGYGLLAIVGHALSLQFGEVAVVWLPAGLSVAVLLREPRTRWPGYLCVVAAIDVVLFSVAGPGPGLGAALAVADVAEPVVGALLLGRLSRDLRIQSPGGVLRLVGAAALTATLVGGVVGGLSLRVADGGDAFDQMRMAYAADAIGVLTVGPLALRAGRAVLRELAGRWLELAVSLLATFAVTVAVFAPANSGPYPYLALAPAIWATLRFGVLGGALTAALAAGPVLVLTGEGYGPFANLAGGGLHEAQVFVAATAILLLLTGSAADAQRAAHAEAGERLREADDVRRRFERIVSSIGEGVFTYRRLPGIWRLEYASPAWSAIFGLPVSPTAGDDLERLVHEDDIEAATAGWMRVEEGEWVEQEYRVVVDGEVRWVNERLRLRVDDEDREWIDGIVADITARRREEARRERIAARLRLMSRTDSLTGLANRRHLSTELERHLADCRDGGPGLGLLLLDLDRFKVVNDTFGHHAGDAILRQTAERIADATAGLAAVAGRWGGEEFCVLVPAVSGAEQLREVAESIRAAIGGEPMRLVDGSELRVTATVGGTLQERGTAARAPELVDRADRALYAGKRRGRDRVVLDLELRAGDATGADSDLLHTAQALALAVSIREGVPALHCQQVADLSARIAEQMGLGAAAVLRARLAGWLHDVGKIAIPDRILGKHGPLDDGEWDVMRAHPVVGAEVVRRIPGLELAAAAIEQHHERWDGGGYPSGRRGADIVLEARIVACADAYSAITSDRVYRAERSQPEGIDELRRAAGSHLDPNVVEALIRVLIENPSPFELHLDAAGG